MSVLFLILAVFIILVHLVVIVGVFLARLQEQRLAAVDRPARPLQMSVLVPARDEEQLLPRLLESLSEQTTQNFEVVLIDDRSEDGTSRIMREFRDRRDGPVQIVSLTEEPAGGNPKQRALAEGAKFATGDLLLMTDADCYVPANWVRLLSRPFRREDTGLAFGPVAPSNIRRPGHESGFLVQYQGFDQLFRFGYTAGAAGLRSPAGGFGNNMAVRRQALEDAGGFEQLRYSLTEDAELIAQVRASGRWRVQAVITGTAAVHPAPDERLRKLFGQSLRWNAGGLFAPDFQTKASYGLVMYYLFGSVILAPFALLWWPLILPAIGSATSMLLMALTVGAVTRASDRYWRYLIPNVLWSMLYYSWVTLFTLGGRTVEWKGRTLRAKGTQ